MFTSEPRKNTVILDAREAREGVTGHGVRYVLMFGLIFGVAALATVLVLALLGVFGDANGASVVP